MQGILYYTIPSLDASAPGMSLVRSDLHTVGHYHTRAWSTGIYSFDVSVANRWTEKVYVAKVLPVLAGPEHVLTCC